jgi:hypothetical protein
MRKPTPPYFASLIVCIFAFSCDNADLNNQNAKDQIVIAKRESSFFSYIEATQINENSECPNNILIFPTWDKYWDTIDALDQMIEDECDAFDATVPNNTSDDDYDALANAVGFDEDNVLLSFEEDLGFCSLRTKLLLLENDWLDQQGNGEWDASTDPDNHFIDDDTERAILSYDAEVIIGDIQRGYVYYKFLDDVGNWIEVHNSDFDAMAQVSNGNIPTNNPNVIVVTPEREVGTSSCKDKVKEVTYEVLGGNRIKRISKVRPAFGTNCSSNPCTSVLPSKIKVKTKGYKWKNGKWRNRRTWVAAGINDINIINPGYRYIDCDFEDPIYKFKEKRRRKAKVKSTTTTYIAPIGIPQRNNNELQDNKLYSYHKQGLLIVNKDFHDMPEN